MKIHVRALVGVALCALFPSMTMAEGGKLVFSTFSFPPFSYSEGSQVKGPFVEIIDAICEEMRYQCTYEFMPNRRAKLTLENGSVNGNFPLGWNAGRDKWLWFTIPLMRTEYGFFARSDSHLTYRTLEDIQGMTIGVFGPSNTANALEQIQKKMKAEGLKPIQIEMHPNADGTGIKKVAAGRYPLYYVNYDVGVREIAEANVANVKYIGKERELLYFAAFAKKHNDKRSVDKFNRAAIKLANDGVIAKLLARYGIHPAQWDEATLQKYNIVLGPPTD
jgi:polar amino acid transport system substrate-binding protein